MPNTYTWPSNAEIIAIDQQMLPTLRKESPIFDILPTVTKNETTLIWEQYENYFGLMQARGLNGAPPRVLQVGLNDYIARPSYYGETMVCDEKQLMDERRPGTFGEPIEMTDAVMMNSKHLLHRQLTLEEYLGWQLLIMGVYQLTSPLTGAVVARDSYVQRIYSPSVLWSTTATATPLQDFRNVWLYHRGYSVVFDAKSNAYMNKKTFNYLVANRNTADLFGQRTGGLYQVGFDVVANLNSINSINQGEDLPMIQVYDRDYYDNTNTDQVFIPDGYVLVVGRRTDGARLGQYVYTRNRANAGMVAGPAYKVWETLEANPDLNVYRGFNGVHQLFFPSGFVVMKVA